MIINNNLHLTYCSNIFKDKNWKQIFKKIKKYIPKIRKNITNKKMALGLCLSNYITHQLIKKKNITELNLWLKNNNIYIPSINGFVYSNFHKKNIKEKIYFPDWTTKKRVNYTKNIINFVTSLYKNTSSYSISTIPISYKPWIKKKNKTYILYKSSINLIKIIKTLLIKKEIIHLDLEPEPTCLIENTKDIIFFFKNWLIPIGKYYFKKDKPIKTNSKILIK